MEGKWREGGSVSVVVIRFWFSAVWHHGIAVGGRRWVRRHHLVDIT
jgi:hypothetical protein